MLRTRNTLSADMFTEISRNVDQQLWLVESHGAPQ
jgi:hypothetical protein